MNKIPSNSGAPFDLPQFSAYTGPRSAFCMPHTGSELNRFNSVPANVTKIIRKTAPAQCLKTLALFNRILKLITIPRAGYFGGRGCNFPARIYGSLVNRQAAKNPCLAVDNCPHQISHSFAAHASHAGFSLVCRAVSRRSRISVAIRHGPEYIVPMQKVGCGRGIGWH
jgi:hypothetical protein